MGKSKFALIIIFIATFVVIGFSQENKKESTPQEKTITEKQKPSEKDLKPQEEKKPEEKKIIPSEEAQQKYGEAELLRESQRNLERSLSTINTVATLICILVGLLALIFTIAGATGFFQFKRWATLRKDIEENAKHIKEIRNNAERELNDLRKEAEKVHLPYLAEKPSKEFKEIFGDFSRKLDSFKTLGLLLKPEDYINRGLDFLYEDKNLSALKDFEKAIELKSDNAEAWHYKGKALSNLNRHRDALTAMEEATKLKPDYQEAWHDKGCALFELDLYEEALKTFEKSIKLKPDSFESWCGKGLSLYELEKYDEAIEPLDKAIDLNPDYADSWYYRACIYSIKKDKEKALSDLSRAIESDAENKKEAKEDKDFKWLWKDEKFKKIIG